MNIMRWFEATSLMAAVQLFTALSAFGFHLDPFFDPERPFVGLPKPAIRAVRRGQLLCL
jgi:hypothetical protein